MTTALQRRAHPTSMRADELETEFDLNQLPAPARDLFRRGALAWLPAVQAAIQQGFRDLDALANLAFFMHHPERMGGSVGRALSPNEPAFQTLSREWAGFRTLIEPLLVGPRPAGGALACRIEDRTSLTPREKRIRTRDVANVHALVLHQMAFSRGNDAKKYDRVTAHYAILPDGKILQLHPVSAYLYASNGFNARSVAVEFAGNFPSVRGRCWHSQTNGCQSLTQAQIDGGRCLVRHLIREIGLTHVLAHRQASATRENDPGPDIWYQVGQWAVDELGLQDGGVDFKIGTGNPIPDAWRSWGRRSQARFAFRTPTKPLLDENRPSPTGKEYAGCARSTRQRLRRLTLAAEKAGAPPGFARFAEAAAFTESRFDNCAANESASEAASALAGFRGALRRGHFPSTPYSEQDFGFGTGGWFGLMPSSALGAGGASGPFASDHPRLVHDPAASVVMLADMVVRMVQRYKAQDWLAVRRGMKGLKFIKDETGSTSLGIRGRFYEALSNTGVADRESFAKQRVDVIRYPGARALYDAIRHTA